MSDVFLSYGAADSALANRLASDLEGRGLSVWNGRMEILPGSDWAQEIERAISDSQNILILISKSSEVLSSWQSSEIAIAVASQRADSRKRIIPLLADGEPAGLPFFLSRFHAVDISTDSAYKKALPSLVSAIASDSPPVPFEASDRTREALIDARRSAIRQEAAELYESSGRVTARLAIRVLVSAGTVFAGGLVYLLLAGSGFIGESGATTLLAAALGAAVAMASSFLSKRAMTRFLDGLVSRSKEARR